MQSDIESTVIGDDDVKLITYKNNGKGGIKCSYRVDGVFDGNVCTYVYSTITKFENGSKLYDEQLSQRYFDVAGVHEGDKGEAKLYTEYPFKDSFPTAKEIFDLGGAVIFDRENTVKAYNIAAIDRFYDNVDAGVPDTLFVYTDDGEPSVVMYSFAGDMLIVTEDMRASEPLRGLYTRELYGKVFVRNDSETEMNLKSADIHHEKEYTSYRISATYVQKDGSKFFATGETAVENITYVKKYIMPEADAERYK